MLPYVRIKGVWVFCFFFFFCRLTNNEKKLEAVRSGVRAISVSGERSVLLTRKSTGWGARCPIALSAFFLSLHFFPTSVFSLTHLSLFSSLLGRPLPPSSPRPLCSCFLLFTSAALSSTHLPSVLIHSSFYFFLPGWLQTSWLRRLSSQPRRGVSSSPLCSVQIRRPRVSSAPIG